jgi:hypothetical protein
MFGRRPDATLVRDLSTMRRFMPFVSPRRNESLVLFAQTIDAEPGFAFLESANASRAPERRITYFHLLLRACALALIERPRLNRFTAGGRLWQRDGVWLTFSAKRAFEDDAPILTVKRRFDGDVSLVQMVDDILDRLSAGRKGRRTQSDNEMDLMLRLPGPLIRALMWLARKADALGLYPRAMIEPDPLFTSAFIANLGSVGLAAGYHLPGLRGARQVHAGSRRAPLGRGQVELRRAHRRRLLRRQRPRADPAPARASREALTRCPVRSRSRRSWSTARSALPSSRRSRWRSR